MSNADCVVKKSQPKVVTAASTEALDQSLGSYVAGRLGEGVRARGSATVVLSGGSTPQGFFNNLAQADLPWPQIRVVPADERWVARDHPDSNEGQLRKRFSKTAITNMVSLRGETENPDAEVDRLNKTLGFEHPIDVVVLGMGADGHTASLFPRAPQLKTGLNLSNQAACLVVDPPKAPHQRISLSLTRLLNAREIIVHITGKEKVAVIEDAWLRADPEQTPISAVLHQQLSPVTVFCDRFVALEG